MLEDTIAAIATPLGEGGLALIRISGKDALALGDKVFQPGNARAPSLLHAPSHTVHYGRVSLDGKIVDEVLATLFRSPRSFTTEDTVEISCHGGLLTTRKVLDAVLRAGARIAEPGEFTRRAFLNGRIDLTQAEAVADLIHARTDLALEAAHQQLAGKLSTRIEKARMDVIHALAHVEAHIDFPDEDISPDTQDALKNRLTSCLDLVESLLVHAEEGRVLRKGIRAAIVGRPNAGKSSLLNELLGQDRAIVSAMAGTTRDTIEETASIRGIPVVFIDTAGLRETEDEIEKEGVTRSHSSMAQAELILHVLDHAEAFSLKDKEYLDQFPAKKKILVINKTDLPQQLHLPDNVTCPVVRVSCLQNQGIEDVRNAISQIVLGGEIQADQLQSMINARHKNALERARTALKSATQALAEGLSLELPAMDLHIAANALGEIIGKSTSEDLLDSIFSQFCLGK